MAVTPKNNDFRADLAALVAGELPQSRVREVLAAIERDPALAGELAEEKALDRLLNFYEIPEPSAEFRKRFWTRFHNEKLLGSSGMLGSGVGRSSRLWLKLVGPIAAALVLTLGLIFWPREPQTPAKDGTALERDSGGVTPEDEEVAKIVFNKQPEEVSAAGADFLRRLKMMDDPRLAVLDGLQQAEDIKLAEQLDLLTDLDDAEEGQ